MRILLLSFIASLYFLVSCQQEPEELILQIQSRCKINTGFYYGGSGGINDSAAFTYSPDGKLSKVEGRDTYVLFNYTGNEITSRRWIDKFDNSTARTDSVYYDAAKKITKLITWYYDPNFNPDSTREIYLYEYASGKPVKITAVSTYFEFSGIWEDTIIHDFTWNAAGNVSKLVYSDASHLPFDSVLYQYDTHPNYFNVVHPHFYLFEPFFEIQVGLIAHFPYFYSKNNVTNFNVYGGWDYPIVYGVDSTNNVTGIDVGGFEYMKYRYQCQ